jgi:hypothetical protein
MPIENSSTLRKEKEESSTRPSHACTFLLLQYSAVRGTRALSELRNRGVRIRSGRPSVRPLLHLPWCCRLSALACPLNSFGLFASVDDRALGLFLFSAVLSFAAVPAHLFSEHAPTETDHLFVGSPSSPRSLDDTKND